MNSHYHSNLKDNNMLIRCTQKARKRLHLKPSDLTEAPDTESLTEWYCNVAVLERRPYFLLTHRLTLFAFWMPLKGNTDHSEFGKNIREYAKRNLKNIGIGDVENVPVLADEADQFAKTSDRAVLGFMVDYVKLTKYQIDYRGARDDVIFLDTLSRYLNDVPMNVLGMDHPRDHMKTLVGS